MGNFIIKGKVNREYKRLTSIDWQHEYGTCYLYVNGERVCRWDYPDPRDISDDSLSYFESCQYEDLRELANAWSRNSDGYDWILHMDSDQFYCKREVHESVASVIFKSLFK